MSLRYNIKSSGPRTLPWELQNHSQFHLKMNPLLLLSAFCYPSSSLTIYVYYPLIPYLFNLVNNIFRSVFSNALFKSRKTAITYLLLSTPVLNLQRANCNDN